MRWLTQVSSREDDSDSPVWTRLPPFSEETPGTNALDPRSRGRTRVLVCRGGWTPSFKDQGGNRESLASGGSAESYTAPLHLGVCPVPVQWGSTLPGPRVTPCSQASWMPDLKGSSLESQPGPRDKADRWVELFPSLS